MPHPMVRLHTDFADWHHRRSELEYCEAQFVEGNFLNMPTASDWQASEDEAARILRALAKLVWPEDR